MKNETESWFRCYLVIVGLAVAAEAELGFEAEQESAEVEELGNSLALPAVPFQLVFSTALVEQPVLRQIEPVVQQVVFEGRSKPVAPFELSAL